MVSMKATRPLNVKFDWVGAIPDDNRNPGETRGHHTFFVECMSCDRNYNNHLLKCSSEEELIELFTRYAARLVHTMPFKLFKEDFIALAANTWKDPNYQAEKLNR